MIFRRGGSEGSFGLFRSDLKNTCKGLKDMYYPIENKRGKATCMHDFSNKVIREAQNRRGALSTCSQS